MRLPEELQTSLVSLLRDYDQEDYTPLAQFSLPNGALLLTNANRGTQFCLFLGETGAPVLVRLNHDGYSASQKKAVLPESLLQDPRWRAFQTSLSSYLKEGWAEDLYALKTPYLGSPSACLAILEELHLSQAVGPYQIALQTERAPYGITLQFQEACPQGALSSATEYLRFCGTVFQALVGNGDRFSWELPLEGSDTPARGTVEKTPWDTTPPSPAHRKSRTAKVGCAACVFISFVLTGTVLSSAAPTGFSAPCARKRRGSGGRKSGYPQCRPPNSPAPADS